MLKPKCSSGTVLRKNPLFMDAVCKTLPIHITSVMLVNLNFLSSLTGTVQWSYNTPEKGFFYDMKVFFATPNGRDFFHLKICKILLLYGLKMTLKYFSRLQIGNFFAISKW